MHNNTRQQKLIMYIVYTVQHKALIYRTIIIHYRELTYKILNNSILKNERTRKQMKRRSKWVWLQTKWGVVKTKRGVASVVVKAQTGRGEGNGPRGNVGWGSRSPYTREPTPYSQGP